MSGQARTTGHIRRKVTLSGRDFYVSPLRIGDYREVEAYLISKRGDPMEAAERACARAPEHLHPKIWEAAIKLATEQNRASTTEVQEFLNTLEGIAYQFYLAARHHEPTLTFEEIHALFQDIPNEELARLSAQVQVGTGEADLKNSSGPEQPGEENLTEQIPAGPPFTSTLQENTTGPMKP